MAFKDECGVFGIWPAAEASRKAYLGLYALQHRGQEAAGICTRDGRKLNLYKGQGHVADVFSESTLDNLKEALGGETYEFQSMYPPMIAEAKAEGNEAAVRTFTYANEVEKVHAALYQKAIDNLSKPQADVDYYVCSVCGYTCEMEAPEECPVCKAKKKAFSKIS